MLSTISPFIFVSICIISSILGSISRKTSTAPDSFVCEVGRSANLKFMYYNITFLKFILSETENQIENNKSQYISGKLPSKTVKKLSF